MPKILTAIADTAEWMVSEEHGSAVCHPLASQNDFMVNWNIGAQKERIDVGMYAHVFVLAL